MKKAVNDFIQKSEFLSLNRPLCGRSTVWLCLEHLTCSHLSCRSSLSVYSVFFPLLLHLQGPFSSSNGCVESPPHLDIFDMKPVEEAVKSTAPFISASLSSRHTVELFSGKNQNQSISFLCKWR